MSKTHLICNDQRLPLKFMITRGGECSDFTEALPLLSTRKALMCWPIEG